MKICFMLMVSLACIGFAQAKEESSKDVKSLECPVKATDGCHGGYCSNKVKPDIHVEHEGRKVYFCCKVCVKSFNKNPEDYLAKVKEQWKASDGTASDGTASDGKSE